MSDVHEQEMIERMVVFDQTHPNHRPWEQIVKEVRALSGDTETKIIDMGRIGLYGPVEGQQIIEEDTDTVHEWVEGVGWRHVDGSVRTDHMDSRPGDYFGGPREEPDEEDLRTCAVCNRPIGWIDSPTGGWWAHEVHPADGHDAKAKI